MAQAEDQSGKTLMPDPRHVQHQTSYNVFIMVANCLFSLWIPQLHYYISYCVHSIFQP